MLIGLISDTHGLMRDEALRALRGSDLIVHAGDIGKPEVITQLQGIARVIAIKGNVDQGEWASGLPGTAVIDAGSARLYVIHDVHDLRLDPAASGYQAVISGHSHRPAQEERNGVLYINPGAAGPRRFKLPVTLALLNLADTPWTVEFIDLLK